MIIDIQDCSVLPAHLVQGLLGHKAAFKRETYVENMYEISGFRGLAEGVDTWIRANHIRVYHCTKAPSLDFFRKHGLRLLDRKSHQGEFLVKYGNLFTDAEQRDMVESWDAYFPGTQDKVRNGRTYFCVSRNLVRSPGTERFLKFFGGEALYMPLAPESSSAMKLANIGIPAVVEVVLPGRDFVSPSYSFSLTMLSYFHQAINPFARIFDCEAHVVRNVEPREVTRVTSLSEFDVEKSR